MGVAVPLRTLERLSKIAEPDEWAHEVRRQIGNSLPEVALNNVLCAVYIANENLREVKTPSGVIIPIVKTTDQIKEDVWQGKMNLVLAVGALAFEDDAHFKFGGFRCRPGDWVSFPNHCAYPREIAGVPCRNVADRFIIEKYSDPRHLTS